MMRRVGTSRVSGLGIAKVTLLFVAVAVIVGVVIVFIVGANSPLARRMANDKLQEVQEKTVLLEKEVEEKNAVALKLEERLKKETGARSFPLQQNIIQTPSPPSPPESSVSKVALDFSPDGSLQKVKTTAGVDLSMTGLEHLQKTAVPAPQSAQAQGLYGEFYRVDYKKGDAPLYVYIFAGDTLFKIVPMVEEGNFFEKKGKVLTYSFPPVFVQENPDKPGQWIRYATPEVYTMADRDRVFISPHFHRQMVERGTVEIRSSDVPAPTAYRVALNSEAYVARTPATQPAR